MGEEGEEGARPLAEVLLLSIADLLFCPDFTVHLITQHGVVRTVIISLFICV